MGAALAILVFGASGPAEAEDDLRRYIDVCDYQNALNPQFRRSYPTRFIRRVLALIDQEAAPLESLIWAGDLEDEEFHETEASLFRLQDVRRCWEEALAWSELNPPRPSPPIIDAGGGPTPGPGTDDAPSGEGDACRRRFDEALAAYYAALEEADLAAFNYRRAIAGGNRERANTLFAIASRNVRALITAEAGLVVPPHGCDEGWPRELVPTIDQFDDNRIRAGFGYDPVAYRYYPETLVIDQPGGIAYPAPERRGRGVASDDDGPDVDRMGNGTVVAITPEVTLGFIQLPGFDFGQVGFPTPTGESVFDTGTPSGVSVGGDVGVEVGLPPWSGAPHIQPLLRFTGSIRRAWGDVDIDRAVAGGRPLIGVSSDGVNVFAFNENAILDSEIAVERYGAAAEFAVRVAGGDTDGESDEDDWVLFPAVRGTYAFDRTEIGSDIFSDFQGRRFENRLDQDLTTHEVGLEFHLGAEWRITDRLRAHGRLGGGFVYRDTDLDSSDCFDGNRFQAGCDGLLGVSSFSTDQGEISPVGGLLFGLTMLYFCDPDNFLANCWALAVNGFYANRPRTIINNPTARGQTVSLDTGRSNAAGGGLRLTIPLGGY